MSTVETSSEHMHTSLEGKLGSGTRQDKRASMQDFKLKIGAILSILPEDSKKRFGEIIEHGKRNPTEIVDVLRKEIDLNRTVIDYISQNIMSPEKAIKELEEMIPKKIIH